MILVIKLLELINELKPGKKGSRVISLIRIQVLKECLKAENTIR